MRLDAAGWIDEADIIASPNCDARPPGCRIELAVVHAISLPPGQFGGGFIQDLFLNRLDPAAHPYFADIVALRVSAHFLIRRDGRLIQFVSCLRRAWHAGASVWQGRERCNDFSLGIELEGSDHVPFDVTQYDVLNRLLTALREEYPLQAVVGHSDIAPGRKTDPGPFFDWWRVGSFEMPR
jgi:AmpD protein